MPTVRDVVQAE